MSLVCSLYLSGIFTSRYLPQLLGCSNTYPRLGISLISSLYLYMISSSKKLVIHDITVMILKVTINFNNCFPFRSTWVHSRFLMGIVLLYLYFYVSFFFWPLCFLSFFDLRILVTSLIFSNSPDKKSFKIPKRQLELSRKLRKVSQQNGNKKRPKRQTLIYIIPYRKPKIEQNKPHLSWGWTLVLLRKSRLFLRH